MANFLEARPIDQLGQFKPGLDRNIRLDRVLRRHQDLRDFGQQLWHHARVEHLVGNGTDDLLLAPRATIVIIAMPRARIL